METKEVFSSLLVPHQENKGVLLHDCKGENTQAIPVYVTQIPLSIEGFFSPQFSHFFLGKGIKRGWISAFFYNQFFFNIKVLKWVKTKNFQMNFLNLKNIFKFLNLGNNLFCKNISKKRAHSLLIVSKGYIERKH